MIATVIGVEALRGPDEARLGFQALRRRQARQRLASHAVGGVGQGDLELMIATAIGVEAPRGHDEARRGFQGASSPPSAPALGEPCCRGLPYGDQVL